MEDKKNRNFPKMAKIGSITFKKRVDVMKLCHGILFIFPPIMEYWCDELLWRSWLKRSLKLILSYRQ